MWGHDLGWWGFVLSVMALLGAYPLSLLANLTSPILKDWWARRSTKSLEKRVAKLQAELSGMATIPLLTPIESKMFQAIRMLMMVAFAGPYFVLGSLALIAYAVLPHGDKSRLEIPCGILLFIVSLLVMLLVSVRRIRKFTAPRSAAYRIRVQRDLTRLRNDLNERKAS